MTTINDFDSTFVNLLSGIATNLNEGNPEFEDNIFKILSNPEQVIIPFVIKGEKMVDYTDVDMINQDLEVKSHLIKSDATPPGTGTGTGTKLSKIISIYEKKQDDNSDKLEEYYNTLLSLKKKFIDISKSTKMAEDIETEIETQSEKLKEDIEIQEKIGKQRQEMKQEIEKSEQELEDIKSKQEETQKQIDGYKRKIKQLEEIKKNNDDFKSILDRLVVNVKADMFNNINITTIGIDNISYKIEYKKTTTTIDINNYLRYISEAIDNVTNLINTLQTNKDNFLNIINRIKGSNIINIDVNKMVNKISKLLNNHNIMMSKINISITTISDSIVLYKERVRLDIESKKQTIESNPSQGKSDIVQIIEILAQALRQPATGAASPSPAALPATTPPDLKTDYDNIIQLKKSELELASISANITKLNKLIDKSGGFIELLEEYKQGLKSLPNKTNLDVPDLIKQIENINQYLKLKQVIEQINQNIINFKKIEENFIDGIFFTEPGADCNNNINKIRQILQEAFTNNLIDRYKENIKEINIDGVDLNPIKIYIWVAPAPTPTTTTSDIPTKILNIFEYINILGLLDNTNICTSIKSNFDKLADLLSEIISLIDNKITETNNNFNIINSTRILNDESFVGGSLTDIPCVMPLGIVFIKKDKKKIIVESHLGISDIKKVVTIEKKDDLNELKNIDKSYLILITIQKELDNYKTLQKQLYDKLTTPPINKTLLYPMSFTISENNKLQKLLEHYKTLQEYSDKTKLQFDFGKLSKTITSTNYFIHGRINPMNVILPVDNNAIFSLNFSPNLKVSKDIINKLIKNKVKDIDCIKIFLFEQNYYMKYLFYAKTTPTPKHTEFHIIFTNVLKKISYVKDRPYDKILVIFDLLSIICTFNPLIVGKNNNGGFLNIYLDNKFKEFIEDKIDLEKLILSIIGFVEKINNIW